MSVHRSPKFSPRNRKETRNYACKRGACEKFYVGSFCGPRVGHDQKMGMDTTRPLDRQREKFELAKMPTDGRVKRIIDELCRVLE